MVLFWKTKDKDIGPILAKAVKILFWTGVNLNEIWLLIKIITNTNANANHVDIRKEDILFSLGNVEFTKRILNYQPITNLDRQMKDTIEDFMLRLFYNIN